MGEPGFMQSHNTTVLITAIDHENYRASWVTAGGLPKWALYAQRWQMLTVEDGKTKYESIEVFSGILAYVVQLFTGRSLVLGVKAMAEGLKSQCERA
jgi:lysozyme family protein